MTEAGAIAIDGIYVDDGYANPDSEVLKRVYVFYTLTPTSNLSLSSSAMVMTIDSNRYEASDSSGDYKGSHMSTGNIVKDIYVGESVGVASVFDIPEADLADGKTITFSNRKVDDAGKLIIPTDDIVRAESLDEIFQAVDPEAYATEQAKYEPADQETVDAVMASICDYTIWSIVGSLRIELSCYWDGTYVLSSGGVSNSGTYTIDAGYIELYSPSNDYTTYIPWEWEDDGSVKLDLYTGVAGN